MEDWILVEFCPCGHIENVKKSTILPSILEEIATGKRLSVPVKHSNDCPQCDEDTRELNRKAAFWDMF